MKYLSLLAALAVLGLGTFTVAQAADWNMRVEAERSHQTFGDGDADLTSVTLSPSIQLQDWSFSASLPWQKIEGAYFVNHLYPSLEYICSWMNGLTGAQKLYLVRRGQLTLAQVKYCNETGGVESTNVEDSREGLSDIQLFANYYLPAFSDTFSGAIGIGYKHDNGDVEEGLGTGTRDLFVETSWSADIQQVGLLLTLGYEHILNNDTEEDLLDYGYAVLGAHWQIIEIARVGVDYNYQQASSDLLQDYDYLTYYLELGRAQGLGVRVYATDYLGEDGFPDKEYGGSLSYTF